MATSTDVPIYTTTLPSAASSITIPLTDYQQYKNLKIVVDFASSNALSFLYIQFNGDTGSNYSLTEMWGNGSSAQSWRNSNSNIPWVSGQVGCTSTLGQTISTINIQNYSNSSTYKTFIARTNNTASASYPGTSISNGMWRGSTGSSTEAITSIVLKNRTGGVDYNFVAGTTISVYGIGTVSTAKAIGGAIYSDSNYWYHVFTNTAAFTPNQTLSCDYVIVGGGGGGGAGGPQATGGGGGYFGYASATLTSGTSYTATVGSGGNGNTGSGSTAGGSSTFNGLTMSGGGAGASNYNPDRGGSSGKNISGTVTNYTGGLTLVSDNSHLAGGGGAGSGANGLDSSPFAPSTPGSVGGDGATHPAGNYLGYTMYFGGGGNGGTEGTGSNGGWGAYGGYIPTYRSRGGGGWGGGQYPTSNPASKPTAGEIATGGGGGGGTWDNSSPIVPGAANGANGGSGVVIVRYAK